MKKIWQSVLVLSLWLYFSSDVCLAMSSSYIPTHVSGTNPILGFSAFLAILAILTMLIKFIVEMCSLHKASPQGSFPRIMPGIHLWMCPIALKDARLATGTNERLYASPSQYLEKDVVVRSIGRDKNHIRLYVDTSRTNYCLLTVASDKSHLEDDAYFFSFQYNTESSDFDRIARDSTYKTTDGLLWTKSSALKGEVGTESLESLSGCFIDIPYRTVIFERNTGLKGGDFQTEYLLVKEITHPALTEPYCQIFTGIHLSVDHCLPMDLIEDYCQH